MKGFDLSQSARMRRSGHVALLAAGVLAGASVSCSDPVLDDIVKAQGKETSGIPKGPFHRAGQECGACHGERGPASPKFSLAGTVFAGPNDRVGVDRAQIQITDSEGAQFIAETNCVGNFFVTAEDYNPRFPILVRVAKGRVSRTMRSVIGREPSCAGCHKTLIDDGNRLKAVGHIYLFGGPEPGGPASDCPVDPDLGPVESPGGGTP